MQSLIVVFIKKSNFMWIIDEQDSIFVGMISSAVLWGFLSDILGRKKLLVYGYLLDGLANIWSAFSQSFASIMTFKFIGGFMWDVSRAFKSSFSKTFSLQHLWSLCSFNVIFVRISWVEISLDSHDVDRNFLQHCQHHSAFARMGYHTKSQNELWNYRRLCWWVLL